MTLFDIILIAKIAITAVGVVIPLAVLHPRKIAQILDLDPAAMRYMRLYAVAIAALLIGYASALSPSDQAEFPYAIAMMGLVSNGGAAALLALEAHVRLLKWGALVFGAIALALAFSIAYPDWAMQPIG